MAAVAAGLMATASSFYQKGRGHSSSTSLETCIMQKCQISSLCERVGGFFFFLVPVCYGRTSAKWTFPKAYLKVSKIPDSWGKQSLSRVIYLVIEMTL